MLQKFNLLSVFILAAILFAGCSEEQSSMSMGDIQGKAKIVGHVSYSQQQVYENGMIVEKIIPAANKQVVIELPNSSLSPNGQAQGYTTLTTVTDSKGNYIVEVPATAKSNGMEVTVKAESFTGRYTALKYTTGNKPESITQDVYYNCPSQALSVRPGYFYVADLRYAFTVRNID